MKHIVISTAGRFVLMYVLLIINVCHFIMMLIPGCNVVIVVIQPLGRSGQRPELSQATGMALVRCILGKFLGVICH